jgi:hypothetical protein
MSQRHSEYERRLADDYPTPSWAAQVVIPYLPPKVVRAWDPAEGAGGMVQALSQAGLPTIGTGGDFLKLVELPDPRINAIVTNPPYGPNGRLAVRFIERARTLVPFVAMLLKVDFDSGRTRVHLFRDCPAFACKLTLLDRIEWFAGDYGSSTNHSWFIWDRTHSGSPTIAYAGKRDVADITNTYNPEDDVWRGTHHAYALIRDRVRQGGSGWTPGERALKPGGRR